MIRSFLFVSGDSEHKMAHARNSAADAPILDLEDSVAAAREAVGQALRRPRDKSLWVRINALKTSDALADLVAVMPGRPDGVVLPKCTSREQVRQLAHYLDTFEAAAGSMPGTTRILAILTETASSLLGLHGYRDATPRLWGLT